MYVYVQRKVLRAFSWELLKCYRFGEARKSHSRGKAPEIHRNGRALSLFFLPFKNGTKNKETERERERGTPLKSSDNETTGNITTLKTRFYSRTWLNNNDELVIFLLLE